MAKSLKHTEDRWIVIVNPNAGRQKIEKDWIKIQELLYTVIPEFFLSLRGVCFDYFFPQTLQWGSFCRVISWKCI